MQLCDLISNASHDDFRRCGAEAASALRQALGAYDFRLIFRELLERVDQYVADGSLGVALIALAERLSQDDVSDDLRTSGRERLTDVVTRLAALGAPARDPQLAILANWLEQVIEQQRSLEVGLPVGRLAADRGGDADAPGPSRHRSSRRWTGSPTPCTPGP